MTRVALSVSSHERLGAPAPVVQGGDVPVRGRVAGWLSLAALGILAGLGGPAAALLAARVPDASPQAAAAPLLAVAPPWIDVDALVVRAGGREASPIRAPMAALAVGDGPDFADRLKAAGAWIVLDGRAIAEFCGAAG